MKNMNEAKIYQVLVWIWMIIMFTVSSIPKLHTPTIDSIIGFDKMAHFAEYLVFSFLLLNFIIYKFSYLKLIYILPILVFLPILDELHQYPIPGRQFSVLDIFADILGGFSMLIIFLVINKFRNDQEILKPQHVKIQIDGDKIKK
ncbi:MAG: VanZ family protein [Candidatus Cloacimonadota bacterium]|nr:VanZ family protein [Candidatus Cloacimonadota bacterium]